MSPRSAEASPGYLLPRRATQLAFGALMLGLLLAALNQTIVATALPHIVSDLGGLDRYSWVFTAYMLASTVTVPIWGRLSDVHGRRPVFVAGVLLFLVGSLVGATAASMAQVIAARGVQGAGAGALIPVAMAAVGDLVPASERGRWQGLLGGTLGVASFLGPLGGGWIADNVNWRWVFLVSLPAGLLALVVGWSTLRIPPHPERSQRVDFRGAALLTAGLSGLLVGIVQWGQHGTLMKPATALALGGGVVLSALFAIHQRRAVDPFVPLELLGDRVVRAASVGQFVFGVALFGAIMFVPLFAQAVLGASATGSGLILMPMMVTMFVTSVVSGELIVRIGRYRWAIISGPPVIALGFGALATLDAGSSAGALRIATVVLGFGLGLLLHNLVLVAQNAVTSRHLGAVTSAAQLFRYVGGTIGVAGMGALLTAGLGGKLGGDAATGDGMATRAAMADALHPIFVAVVPLVVVAWWWLLRIPERTLLPEVRGDADGPRSAEIPGPAPGGGASRRRFATKT